MGGPLLAEVPLHSRLCKHDSYERQPQFAPGNSPVGAAPSRPRAAGRVPAYRRRRGIGHAGHRREGESPARGGDRRHQLRRGRARLPDAGRHRRGRRRRLPRPRSHHYTPSAGLPALREAIAAKTRRDSGFEVTAAQVLVTNGAKHALSNAFATLLDPGDEVLIIAPYWTTYPESAQLSGGVPVIVPTDESTDFLGDAEPRGPASRAPRCCSSPRLEPDRGRLPPAAWPRSAGWPPSGAGGWSPTRSTSTSSTTVPSSTRCRSCCPSSPTAASW